MNSIYSFSYCLKGKTERKREVVASSYQEAIEKASLILEDVNDKVDLIGLNSWEDVQDECENYNLKVSDLIEDYDD